jgi:hypothetical protein
MASNILSLASNFFSLTTQGPVGAGMNCRALQHPWMFQLSTSKSWAVVANSSKILYDGKTILVFIKSYMYKDR